MYIDIHVYIYIYKSIYIYIFIYMIYIYMIYIYIAATLKSTQPFVFPPWIDTAWSFGTSTDAWGNALKQPGRFCHRRRGPGL
jgi:hypothetical protein